MQNENDLNSKHTRYIPVPNWEKHHDWPKIGGLRNLIFNGKTNGFDQFNVIKRVGRRVLINEAAFFEWVANQGKGA